MPELAVADRSLLGRAVIPDLKLQLKREVISMGFEYRDTKLMIDGTWRCGVEGKSIPVIDPATTAVIGSVSCATVPDLDAALASADSGFKVWSATSSMQRSRLMRAAAELLRERSDRVAYVVTREQGKPLKEAKGEVLLAAEVIDWFAEEARRTYGQVIPARGVNTSQMTIKLPVGPTAAFTPWNFPVNQVVRKLSAALAAGCSMIVKASEETPASAAELIQVFMDAGLPPGVVNLVFGDPAEISGYLIPHPVVRKISFTGSTSVGMHLAGLAGRHMKRATMELGGHAPAIVCDDADLQKAVKILLAAKFRNAGQVCIAPTRILVHQRLFEPFLSAFTKGSEALNVANGLDEGAQMGPLSSHRRVVELESLIDDALKCGARVASGGRRIGTEGYFFEPTVLTNVPNNARVMNEEPFGPVAVVNPFSTIDDAIHEANRLQFGLASYVFTSSSANAHVLGVAVEAGMTAINNSGLGLPELPFGGVKESGYGSEGGADATEPYLVTKLICSSFYQT